MRAVQSGAFDFIEKPFKADRLVLVADRALEASRLRREVTDLRARAGAIDELLESGALTDLTGDGRDSIDRELEKLTTTSGVDAELEKMRAELGAGAPPPDQLGSGEPKP